MIGIAFAQAQDRHDERSKALIVRSFQVLLIDPVELGGVEFGRRSTDVLQIEPFDKLRNGEDFIIPMPQWLTSSSPVPA